MFWLKKKNYKDVAARKIWGGVWVCLGRWVGGRCGSHALDGVSGGSERGGKKEKNMIQDKRSVVSSVKQREAA